MIAWRIAALVEERAERASVVALTFTERAAAELKERIGTIHAYCFRILRTVLTQRRSGTETTLDTNRRSRPTIIARAATPSSPRSPESRFKAEGRLAGDAGDPLRRARAGGTRAGVAGCNPASLR